MNTSINNVVASDKVKAIGVRFDNQTVFVQLNDGREVGVPLSHRRLGWLARATPDERSRHEITPDGQMIMWWNLNNGGDGFEVAHLLDMHYLV